MNICSMTEILITKYLKGAMIMNKKIITVAAGLLVTVNTAAFSVFAADENSVQQISPQVIYVSSDKSAYAQITLDFNVQDINDKGQIVGFARKTPHSVYNAYMWENGKITDLGGNRSFAYSINNKGQIVGESDNLAFVWKNGVKTILSTLGGDYSSAKKINECGVIIGDSLTKDGATHAFVCKNGKMVDLGTLGGKNSYAVNINDNGQVIGLSETTDGKTHSFLWQNGKMTDLGTLGGGNTFVSHINNKGHIVGSSDTVDGFSHAFIWKDGHMMKDLGTLGGNISSAVCINEDGKIVGYGAASDGILKPVEWKSGKISEIKIADSVSGSAQYIDSKGRIVGTYRKKANTPANVFMYEKGKVTDFGALGYFSSAFKINKNGDFVGNGVTKHGGYVTGYLFKK